MGPREMTEGVEVAGIEVSVGTSTFTFTFGCAFLSSRHCKQTTGEIGILPLGETTMGSRHLDKSAMTGTGKTGIEETTVTGREEDTAIGANRPRDEAQTQGETGTPEERMRKSGEEEASKETIPVRATLKVGKGKRKAEKETKTKKP